MNIGIYIYDNCMLSTAVGLCDIFSVANTLHRRFGLETEVSVTFKTTLLSWDGSDIKASNGRTIAAEGALKTRRAVDILIIPGMMESHAAAPFPELCQKLTALERRGKIVCSICAGSYYLASSGLLDGKRATTHWILMERFRETFPRVKWVPNQLLVKEGNLITAGGVSAYQELALFILETFGAPLLAKHCSAFMLIEPGRNHQAPYQIAMFPRSHADEPILALQSWLEKDFAMPITVQKMLSKAGMSERTLMRRFKRATGYTPLQYLQEQRLFKAKALLETSRLSFEEITWQVGYEDANSFRQLFRKRIGMSPGIYRKRFAPIGS